MDEKNFLDHMDLTKQDLEEAKSLLEAQEEQRKFKEEWEKEQVFGKAKAEDVNTKKAGWKFDSSVAPVFDEHVRKSVPMYENFHHQVKEFSNWFVEDGTHVYDIGTSTGQTILNLLELHKDKDVSFFGIDTSHDMTNQAWNRLHDTHDIEEINATVDFIDGDALSEKFGITNASYVTSILSAQFIPVRKRLELFHKIYRGLNRGGAFILVEKIVDQNPYINDMYVQVYHDMKLDNGFSSEHVIQKQASLRGAMRPITINENLELLLTAGFDLENISQFFKWNNFAGFIAIKD